MLVNQEIGPSEIALKYLEAGHTSMPADSVHGHIEKELQRHKDVLDIEDLHEIMGTAVKDAKIVNMDYTSYFDWEHGAKTRGATNLPLLKDIVEVTFMRGETAIFYKAFRAMEPTRIDFLKKKWPAA